MEKLRKRWYKYGRFRRMKVRIEDVSLQRLHQYDMSNMECSFFSWKQEVRKVLTLQTLLIHPFALLCILKSSFHHAVMFKSLAFSLPISHHYISSVFFSVLEVVFLARNNTPIWSSPNHPQQTSVAESGQRPQQFAFAQTGIP